MQALLKDIRNYFRYIESLNINYLLPAHVNHIQQTTESKEDRLKALNNAVRDCTLCRLSGNRNNLVFGQGSPNAELMFIGEGPGEEEDRQGLPFVGRSGQLLDKIFEAMNLNRSLIYIANIVKCRPPGNRNPGEDEISLCLPILKKQIDIICPKVICVLGSVAFNTLIGRKLPIGANRGKWHDYNGIRLMPTFHPSYILRNNTIKVKKLVWEDMKQIMGYLNIKK